MGAYTESQQARFDKSFVSCGVIEMHHLPKGSPSATAFALANNLYHKANGRPGAFVIFSDAVDEKGSRGQLLAAFLESIKAGRMFASPREVNPKTGHVIQVWVLTLDHDTFRKWYAEEYVNRIDEQ